MRRRRFTFSRVVDGLSIGIVAFAALLVVARIAVQQSGDARMEDGAFYDLLQTGHRLGPRSAPVQILVYNDYECGFCKELHTTLRILRKRYPQHVAVVVKDFVDPVRLTHYKVPLGAHCAAEQGRFAAYHTAAFRHSRLLGYSAGWRILADSAAVPDTSSFDRCVQTAQYTTAITEAYAEAQGLGIVVTPTLFVNGLLFVGAPPLATLDSLITAHFPGRVSTLRD